MSSPTMTRLLNAGVSFTPFAQTVQAVRWNTPWYRRSWHQTQWFFSPEHTIKQRGFDHLMSKPSGRRIMMRNILEKRPMVAWGVKAKLPDQRINGTIT